MDNPIELDGARVILHTINSEANNYGSVGILGDDNEIIDELPITAMAICHYEGSSEYYLFSCDLNWEVIGDFDHDSLEDAKESAKINHNVKDEDWKIV
ncbi:hypothetical protein [Gottfriedia solisilvae]|uniref:Uncharacterized protein n=1 Tax=Gottfriedia solisilvae TaxID=1516104 RepID=A0A8J3AFG6_9BACI|nr:hypothetical protein [Gottfriedia solisilvae]GGI11528.1 hypothetical protein GCM10007380_08290 [Gottfriedia solisilvae]